MKLLAASDEIFALKTRKGLLYNFNIKFEIIAICLY